MTTLVHTLTRRIVGFACVAAVSVVPASLFAQDAAAALAVGNVAPDFTVKSVNAAGVIAKPFKLSEHKGETVVLAFFPKARTSGCTMQMESYRDQYASTFNGGKKVTLLSISIDSDTALINWAKDAKFPFAFGSDEDRTVGKLYGANSGTGWHKRLLYVVGPDGKIAYMATPFKQMAAESYVELGAAIAKSAGTK